MREALRSSAQGPGFHPVPQYERTLDQELRQFWGITYEEFISHLVAAASPKEGDSVLDLATGTALLPRRVSESSDALSLVVGLDNDPAKLRTGRRLARDPVELICGSAMKLPFASGSFDVVVCGLGPHLMDMTQLLVEAERVLKPGGKLTMSDAGLTGFWSTFLARALLRALAVVSRWTYTGSKRTEEEERALLNLHTVEEWRVELTKQGFGAIEIRESFTRPWSPNALTIRAIARRKER